jgi:hypothetical protein
LNLVNFTRFEAGLTLATDKDGYERVVVVTKGAFTILTDRACVRSKDQLPLVLADQYNGEPGLSSLKYESDFALNKPKTDIILNGTAYAPGGQEATSVDVTMEVGPVRKTIRVYGDRMWERSLLKGFVPSTPKPFRTMPLVYERAFGGVDRSDPDEKKQASEIRNLVGEGFHVRFREAIAGTPVPNLEDPGDEIRKYTDKPRPMAFGFISRNWQPRASHAGTYDQNWLDTRFPFLPVDFDERHFQGAPEDQTCTYLKGGESVKLTNLTPEGTLQFALPQVSPPVRLVFGEHWEDPTPVLDTVLLEPDRRLCVLGWRVSWRLKGKPTDLLEVWVGKPSPGRRRALETGKTYLERLGVTA